MQISFVATRALLIVNAGISSKVVGDHCSSRRRSDQQCANSQPFNAIENTLRGAQYRGERQEIIKTSRYCSARDCHTRHQNFQHRSANEVETNVEALLSGYTSRAQWMTESWGMVKPA